MDEAIEQVGAPPHELCEAGFDENELLAMGFLQGCSTMATVATLAPACTCDCEEREAEERKNECGRICRKLWRECPLPAGSIPDDLEAQVAMYREYMTQKGVPENVQKGLLDAFSKAPEYQRRMMLESCR